VLVRNLDMLKWFARIPFLILTLFWGIFSFLSGANEYGGGIIGIIKNSPNAIPWLVLLVVNYIGWKWEIVGGVIILLIGLFLSFFFNMWRPKGLFLIGMIFIPMEIIGILFLINGVLEQKKRQKLGNNL
jgi:hypothetical protein